MQCPTCPEMTATAFCRACGKPVCRQCATEISGVTHCAECAEVERTRGAESTAAAAAEAEARSEERRESPPSSNREPRSGAATAASDVVNDAAPHPVLAGVLGFVPGLGAVYNGQYLKGVIHVVLFGLLMTIATSSPGAEPLFGPVIALFVLYMPIEAVRTAQAMRRGERVEELSGLIGVLIDNSSRSPAAGVALIAVGAVLLLFTLGVFSLREVARFWPVLIILLGVYRLYRAVKPAQDRLDERDAESL